MTSKFCIKIDKTNKYEKRSNFDKSSADVLKVVTRTFYLMFVIFATLRGC